MRGLLPRSHTVALVVPFFVAEGAHGSRFEPTRDAVEVERVIAGTPSLRALFRSVRDLLRLALHTRLHDVVSADGTVIDVDVPRPERDGIPFFNFESCLWRCLNHV